MPGHAEEEGEPEVVVDLRGLLCPIPVIRTSERVAALPPGARLRLECTDPGVREDLPIWARMHGHAIEAIVEEGTVIVVRLRVADSAAP